jgi:hypothetical protein
VIVFHRETRVFRFFGAKASIGQVRFPSHIWGSVRPGSLSRRRNAGEAWAEVVRSAWLESGGSEETFEATFPQLAYYARKQPAW